MTKRELLEKINLIANKVSDLETSLSEAKDEARNITRLIEDIPDEPGEITDDEEDGE